MAEKIGVTGSNRQELANGIGLEADLTTTNMDPETKQNRKLAQQT